MVCARCIRIVREELRNIGLVVTSVSLGKATVENKNVSLTEIKEVLLRNGFDLIEDKNLALVEEVKTLLIEKINGEGDLMKFKLSVYLEQQLNKKYSFISRVFSRVKGKTIERYFIELKIEKVKELIDYNELSFSEIAFRLGYSALQHLSSQFKRMTGISMSAYRENKNKKRISIDSI